jgi:hypothetical protein
MVLLGSAGDLEASPLKAQERALARRPTAGLILQLPRVVIISQ